MLVKLYKYELRDAHGVLETCEAETLNEASKKMNVGDILHSFAGCATVMHKSCLFGVTWSPVKPAIGVAQSELLGMLKELAHDSERMMSLLETHTQRSFKGGDFESNLKRARAIITKAESR